MEPTVEVADGGDGLRAAGEALRNPSAMETEEVEMCVTCQQELDGSVFTWPGCHNSGGPVLHRMHTRCLGGMFASLPGWPVRRPEHQGLLLCVQEGMRRAQSHQRAAQGEQPCLACPVCRHSWRDIQAMAAALQQMDQWPVPARQPAGPQGSSEEQGIPRPALLAVFCSSGVEEMTWTMYRPSVADPTVLGGRRPGHWLGEFHCSARAREGAHTAPADPADVPSLWWRVPAPRAALPRCQCQMSVLSPILMHSPQVGDHAQWHAAWQCHSCGVHAHTTVEQAIDVSTWLLAVDRLSPEHWHAAATADTSDGFWSAVRDRIAESVLDSASGSGVDYFTAGPPAHFAARTNSRIFVPLLLDASGLLSAVAQRA